MTKTTCVYKTAGGCPLKVDVYRPDDGAVRPVLFWIHGGALILGGRGGISEEKLSLYLRSGCALVSIDYRLAPETKLPAIIEDVEDAYGWVREEGSRRFRLDPDRIAVVGHSAGGYLTLVCGFRARPRPKALVSFYGYGDIVGGWYARPDPFYGTSPLVAESEARAFVGSSPVADLTEPGVQPPPGNRGQFYLFCRQHGLWPKEVAGFDPDTERERFRPYNPLWNVTAEYPPTLLLHGDIDTDVPYAQSVLMAYELQRQGVAHELYTALGGGHGFDGKGLAHPDVAAAYDRVQAFLKRHL